MDKLLEKYPALGLAINYIKTLDNFICEGLIKVVDSTDLDGFYKDFKANISCIGLDPSEYDLCIKWFCDTMEY